MRSANLSARQKRAKAYPWNVVVVDVPFLLASLTHAHVTDARGAGGTQSTSDEVVGDRGT